MVKVEAGAPKSERSDLARKAMSKTDMASMAYARMMVRLFTSDRLAVYNKLKSLLRNRFSLMDALDRMYQIASKNGKSPDDSMAIALSCWMRSIQNGDSFATALRGWAPSTELLMLSVGDVASLELALENTIKVVEGVNAMKEPVVGAVSYPLFLMFFVVLMIYMVGVYMVPPMVDAVPNLVWKNTAKSLVDLSTFVQNHPIFLFSILPTLVIIIVWTFPRWKGRSRTIADRMPPWSIYRTFIGVGWLLSLAALVRAGTPVSKAMRSLRADASPYLLYRIDRALIYINNGENLGDALYRTGLEFPDDEIVGDLRIYAELDNFSDALTMLSDQWLTSSIKSIQQKAEILNSIAILSIAIVIAWVVYGTFDMQNQMVSGMGIGGG